MDDMLSIMALAPVIPVLTIDNAVEAAPLAQALVAGGLRAIEVTLRTPAALAAIAAMRQVDGAVVGAGTLGDCRRRWAQCFIDNFPVAHAAPPS